MLDAYKLVSVAKRQAKRGFTAASSAQRMALLLDPNLYQFALEAHSAFVFGAQLLRESAEKEAQKTCEDQQKAVLSLRKSFLLNPSEEAAELLGKIYQDHHLELDARFFRYLSFYKTIKPVIAPHFDENELEILESMSRSFMSRPVQSMRHFEGEATIDWINFLTNFDPLFKTFIPTREVERGEQLQIQQDPIEMTLRSDLEGLKFVFAHFSEARVLTNKSGLTATQLAIENHFDHFVRWIDQFFPELKKMN